MTTWMTPKTDILPPPQQKIWRELSQIPNFFTLYGGTAIALYLGHRESIDFDFFAPISFDPDTLYTDIPLLEKSKIIQKSANTLTVLVERNGPVQLSFFGTPKLARLRPPQRVAENNLNIADLLDLAGTKAAVVQKRAEAKDYIDIDALIHRGHIDLPTQLSAGAALYGPTFSPEITLKSLCYFEDGNVHTIPPDMRDRLIHAVRQVDLDHLPVLKSDNEIAS
jgi:Nucleotidyl transferase AbiEii toxin, Type IV TA system